MADTTLAPEISVADYIKLRDGDSQPLLLDVREPWEFATAHIDGATLIPMGEMTSRAHAEIDPDQPIVVMCHHGARSLSVTMWMRREGFEHVQSLAGGIDEWSRSIDPQIPRY
jgi:rhodanese-related sulfurtransferase